MNTAAGIPSHLDLVHEEIEYEMRLRGTIMVVAAGWRCNHTRRKDSGRRNAPHSAAQPKGGASE